MLKLNPPSPPFSTLVLSIKQDAKNVADYGLKFLTHCTTDFKFDFLFFWDSRRSFSRKNAFSHLQAWSMSLRIPPNPLKVPKTSKDQNKTCVSRPKSSLGGSGRDLHERFVKKKILNCGCAFSVCSMGGKGHRLVCMGMEGALSPNIFLQLVLRSKFWLQKSTF